MDPKTKREAETWAADYEQRATDAEQWARNAERARCAEAQAGYLDAARKHHAEAARLRALAERLKE